VAELVGHCDQPGVLNDLERKRHVGRPGNTGHVAGGLGRIIGVPGLEVFSFLGERGGLIWNFAALDYALPRRHPQGAIVVLKVPRGGAQHLPEAVQVGLAVGRARNASRRRLRPGGWRQKESPEGKPHHGSLAHAASIIGLAVRAGKPHIQTYCWCPDENALRLERYVSAIWESGAQPVVILNKADLCELGRVLCSAAVRPKAVI